jgi:hypothetical protein
LVIGDKATREIVMIKSIIGLVIKSFIFAVILVGATILYSNLKTSYVDRRFESQLDLFKDLYYIYMDKEINISNIRVTFGRTAPGRLAVCKQRFLFGQAIDKEIIVDRFEWGKNSITGKNIIMFHELGHCALHRHHEVNTAEPGQCPRSLMVSSKMPDSCFKQNLNHYMLELFGLIE